jgi:serine/threonine-protein kinase
MPFVEGESLGDRMEREQQLPFADALQITREAADALAFAHSRGLVHRDIKPDNIMLSGGHAVVTDFGIARAVDAAGAEKLTQTGMAVGTPAYMSPEQGVGEQVDGRADIYSLGCVLYEMLVGQPPFTGPTAQAVMARHSIDAVPRPQIVRQTIPDDLEDVILTALAKAPADRFRTASEFSEALAEAGAEAIGRPGVSRVTRARGRAQRRRKIRPLPVALSAAAVVAVVVGMWFVSTRVPGAVRGATDGGLDPRRIAVLYFEDLTPAGELGYVADGLTEGLIDQLSQVRGLDVISRNGVASFKEGNVSRDSIARALQVGSLIEGAVESVGDQLRVTLRLVDGATAVDFDRASFELPAGEFLAARDSMAREVSGLLRERLGEEIRVRERRAGTESVEAWALVLRGERATKRARERREDDDLEGAVSFFAQADSLLAEAESLDGNWVEPIVLRARAAYLRSRLETDPHEADKFMERAVGHAERALGLDENNAAALEVRGTAHYQRWFSLLEPDPEAAAKLLDAAERDLSRATELDPEQAGAWNVLSHLYYQRDDIVEANNAARQAYEADAYLTSAASILWRLYATSYDLEVFPQAIRWCDEGRRRFPGIPNFSECKLWLLASRAMDPNVDEAWRLAERVAELTAEHRREFFRFRAHIVVAAVLARAAALDPDRGALLADSARSVLSRSRANPEIDPTRELIMLQAYARTALDDRAEAVDLLSEYFVANPERRRGFAEHQHWWWRSLHDDPRFRQLVGMTG